MYDREEILTLQERAPLLYKIRDIDRGARPTAAKGQLTASHRVSRLLGCGDQ